MKHKFSFFVAIWTISIIVFSVICFVTQAEVWGSNGFKTSFWIGYGFIILAFLGNLFCTALAFKATTDGKWLVSMFYKFPLISLSYGGLIVMLCVGSIVMAISAIPNWIGIIVCLLVLAITAIEIIKAYAAAEYVADIDRKVETATSFIKTMNTRAESLKNRAKSDVARETCKNIVEAIRYSDPMSNQGLYDAENRISLAFEQFSNAVERGEDAKILETGELVQVLIRDRNQLCKSMK